MKKNVAYILGAGFSAPLGIPVMRNFIDKARQIRRANSQYQYFNNVITLVQATVSASSYFQHDSTNIEEALSLLEMKDLLDGGNTKSELVRFIIDVVRLSTPAIPQFNVAHMPVNGWSQVFTNQRLWPGYCSFVASMAHLQFREGKDYDLRGILVDRAVGEINYSVLSLNYDLVLENVCEFVRNSYWWGKSPQIVFSRVTGDGPDQPWPSLVKIHGSIDSGDIIPPTFNKGLYGADLPGTWRQAYQILMRANEIRVIGYSLPQTDSYIKYLLMASVDKFKDLDRIDWIARDTQGGLKERLSKFIHFENKYLATADVSNYLNSILNHATHAAQSGGVNQVSFHQLEPAHQEFMASYGTKIT